MPVEQQTAQSYWSRYVATETEPWDQRRVVHLHRRAAFAASWPEIQRDLADGPEQAVDRLLQGRSHEDSARRFETMARTIGDAATASGSPGRLKAWWLYRMLMSPDPLGERLTLMWHNHFATSNRKVQDLVRMREQNELLRKHARGPFGELLEAVVKHPAMLVWLDADSNRKGHPNENLARELMELFTLGIGNYTEDDVKEAARALTGWTIIGTQFGFREARHDDGEKTVLGERGPLSGDNLLKLLLDHPAMARRLAWRICHTFMGEGVVNEQSLSELADGLSSHGLDIGWGIEAVLRSKLFFSATNLRTRIVGPVECVVGALIALELCDPPPSTLLLAEWVARMGQDLFYPPNVGGWNEGRAWLGSRTIIARANFASALVEGRLWHPTREPGFEELLRRHGEDGGLNKATTRLATLLWGEAPPSVVEEVVAAAKTTNLERRLSSAVMQLLARPEHQLA
jgi:uncharacterized protein (DUF1800 family)